MKTFLIETLETLGFPVILQGTIAENEPYPNDFITFFTTDTEENAAFDNETALTTWNFQIGFYSSNPAHVATESKRIRATLKNAGFIPQGKGYDIPSGVETHTGWICEFYYLENEGVIS